MLALCVVASVLAVLAAVVCMSLDGLGVMHAPLALILVLGAVLVAGVLVVPLLVALAWSVALAVARSERPVRTAFKGVFGFIHQAMQIVSVPFVP